jgi:subtilisin family serine protease
VFNDAVPDPVTAASDLGRRHGLGVDLVYGTAIKGFAAAVPEGRLAALTSDPRVRYVERDQVVTLSAKPGGGGGGAGSGTQPAQSVPSGVTRIGAHTSPTAKIDGVDERVNVDVAVIDTGIDTTHPDLNVVGGVNFSTGKSYVDGNGHGTHVSGTIAAKDNNFGVVGVAPGARLWSVRVLDNSGSGLLSGVLKGIDWVAARGDIEVANMSLGASGSSLNAAVNGAVSRGVVFAVAAGNESADAANYTPAGAASALTVSALRDTDDTFAYFSNYGSVVDLIAPGVNILSTWKGGGYKTISGTSMATPHVAGAAALYRAVNPGASPAQVAAALQGAGEAPQGGSWPGDPDGTAEPLVNVSGF